MNLNPKSAINISSLPKDHCFGCGACVSACPLDCIQMVLDQEGFFYPRVDENICNACRKCVRVCPGFNDIHQEDAYQKPKFFGGYSDNNAIRTESSSGGLFSAFAEQTLSQGGTVYGAVYNFEQMAVNHSRAASPDELASLRTSKYVQSDTHGVFKQVKQDLEAGLPVLFTGSPCQAAGLRLYLNGPKENLLTIDLVCHGVPSPGLFASHFSAWEDDLGSPITLINFRTKDKGWGSFLNFYLKVKTKDRSILTYAPLDPYYAIFLANLSLRPVCYQCKFASTERVTDLTLGDFWGVQKNHPELFDGKGVSLILASTPKGKDALAKLKAKLTLKPLDGVYPMPPNLVRPTPKPRLRDGFLKSIRFARWGRQRPWKHLQALLVLVGSKIQQGVKKFLSLT
jgi:coenzyme F420-reducing hydrogenase beta subunit